MIAKSPKIGLFKIERPEIVAWDFARYARLLVAAKAEGELWYTGVCLAGEAGLRILATPGVDGSQADRRDVALILGHYRVRERATHPSDILDGTSTANAS